MTVSTGHTGAARRPVALFVMGVQRSGTSALARVLSLCGAALPGGLLSADLANPRGYWEPRAAVDLNEAILQRHGSDWGDPTLRLQEEGVFDAEEQLACIAKIRAFLTTLPAAPLLIIKEPRITALSGMWFEATRLAGYDVAVVIAVRRPQEVIASLAVHGGASSTLSSALWLKSNLLAEKDTRGLPRVFVDYANLLDDWRRETKRISAALAIDLNTPDEGAVEDFLRQDLRHQRHHGPVIDLFGTNWISDVYEALCAAARDEPLNASALDRVFEAYRACEHDFRTLLEDYRSFHNFVSPRLSIVKLIGGVRAIARRAGGFGPRLSAGC